MQPSVTEALNVCTGSDGHNAGYNAWGNNEGGCISMGNFDSSHETSDYFTKALAEALDAGIPVTFFYGKVDLACDYVGGENMAMNLKWKGQAGFKAAPKLPVSVGGSPATQMKTSGLLTIFYVDQAGHMVPTYKPDAALALLRRFLRGHEL